MIRTINNKISVLRIILICLLCIFTAADLMPVYAAGASSAGAGADSWRSSFEYKKYDTHKKYRRALLWRMRSVYTLLNSKMDDSLTLPIPGLILTSSASKGKVTESNQFVPQGICRADNYWLVTAYDAERKCNSVIYAVDPARRELVSTVILPYRYHAGGIAFDGENIWLTGDTSDKYKDEPFLQYIRYDDFLDMISSSFHRVAKNEISERVYIKNKPSFLEYDSGTLWVGTYIGKKNTSDAFIYGYDIITSGGDSGMPPDAASDTDSDIGSVTASDTDSDMGSDAASDTDSHTDSAVAANRDVKLNTIMFSVISGIDSSAQGVDIDGDYMYVSSSSKGYIAGVKSSFVTKYSIRPLRDGMNNLSVSGRELKRVEVPKMNEEILAEDGHIYILFESASEAWKKAVIMTDRILAVDQSLWN